LLPTEQCAGPTPAGEKYIECYLVLRITFINNIPSFMIFIGQE